MPVVLMVIVNVITENVFAKVDLQLKIQNVKVSQTETFSKIINSLIIWDLSRLFANKIKHFLFNSKEFTNARGNNQRHQVGDNMMQL